MVVAPASADAMAKIPLGISDNLLLSVIRCWDYNKPCVICPAMNTVMWENPITLKYMHALEDIGWKIIHPVPKKLACQEVGNGAMAAVADICEFLENLNIHATNEAEETAAIKEFKTLIKFRKGFERTQMRDSPIGAQWLFLLAAVAAVLVAIGAMSGIITISISISIDSSPIHLIPRVLVGR